MAYTEPTDTGVASYNNHTFSLWCKTSISGRPVLDSAKRTISYIEYTIMIEDVIVPSSAQTDIGPQVETIRRQLSARGGRLEVSSKGFGDFVVNDPAGGARDVAYGPVPEVLELEPVGSRMAWRLKWRCLVCVPECSSARHTGLMEFVYAWGVRVDEFGYSTRTISGKATVAATALAGDRKAPDHADRYWERIYKAFPPLRGFKRATDRNLSSDRRTLTFTITDVEMEPGSFLPGIVQWDADHEASRNSEGGKWFQPVVAINGTYQVSRTAGKQVALRHFLLLVQAALKEAEGDPFPLEFTVRNRVRTREVGFTFRYYHLTDANANPARALRESGMWVDVPGADWAKWAASMHQTALAARGNAQIFYSAEADLLIDLCGSEGLGQQGEARRQKARGGGEPRILRGKPPKPENSWLHHAGHVEVTGDDGTTVMRTLPLAPLDGAGAGAGGSRDLVSGPPSPGALPKKVRSALGLAGAGLVNTLGGSAVTRPAAKAVTHIQRRTAPLLRVKVVGEAVRWGHAIVPPALLGAFGGKAVLEKPRFVQKIHDRVGGVPVIAGRWENTYVVQAVRNTVLPFAPVLLGN